MTLRFPVMQAIEFHGHVSAPPEALRAWLSRPESRLRLSPPARWPALAEAEIITSFQAAARPGGTAEAAGSTLVERLASIPGRPAPGLRHVESLLRWRQERIRRDVTRHYACSTSRPWRIVISGASGLIGSQLRAFLAGGGYDVRTLVRRPARAPHEIEWQPDAGHVHQRALEACDALVHLSGASIAARWNARRKQAIRDSRVRSTQLLSQALARLDRPPAVLVCASAVGYYGNRGDEELTEDSAPGTGFLPEVCRAWEAAADAARGAGIRVVPLRIGMVLSARGGALPAMLTPFRLGLGGPISGGRQYMSWISLDDLLGVVQFAMHRDELSGAVNAVAPRPVTNHYFTRTLGRVLRRPTLLSVPGAAIELLAGEMGRTLLLEGCRALPRRLSQSGFTFFDRELEPALRWELGMSVA